MSRQSAPLQALPYVADGDHAAYRAIGFDGAIASAQGQKVMGVSQRAATDTKVNDVVVSGTTVVETGGAFAVGGSLIVDAQGRAIAATGALAIAAGATGVTSSAANGEVLEGADLPEYVFADALEVSGGAGEFVEVLLRR